MTWFQLIFLALIQGLSEFLPISSSAHLILPSQLLGWDDQGPLIDVMAHFGSLFAVLLYFRRDVADILRGFVDLLQRKLNTNSALALNLILSTPPALIAGFFLATMGWDEAIRLLPIIAFTTIFFGVLLWLSDVKAKSDKPVEELTWGVSMLMSLPIIGAGGLYAMLKLMTAETSEQTATLTNGLVVAGLAFVAAYACIALFMKWVGRIGFFPFMLYRLALGAGLLLFIFTN